MLDLMEERMTEIYCNNTACPNYKTLNTSVKFNFDNKNFKAWDDDLFTGTCSAHCTGFVMYEPDLERYYAQSARCLGESLSSDIPCLVKECSWNDSKGCTRKTIFVDKDKILRVFVCRSFSATKIRGHRDWFNLLNGNQARGGHIDDDYAIKMDKKARTFTSFGDGHHRESNPRTPKRDVSKSA
jgi:hypothetical protein